MVHKTTLRAGKRFRETRTGRNRIAAERQIERKYDPRKPLMHPRSRCKRRRVLASLPVVSQTMFFRNGSKFTLSKRAKASVWTRQSRHLLSPATPTSVAAGVREIGSISRFPANTAQGDGVHAAEAENTMLRGSSWRTYPSVDGWMDAVSREIRLAGTTPAAV